MLAGGVAFWLAILGAQDTTVVRADNAPAWGDSIELVEVARFGSLDGSDGPAFGRITGVVGLPGGATAVADGQAQLIRIFDADGTAGVEFGGKGQGPGEFEMLDDLALAPDGTLVAWDMGNSRVSYFSVAGELLRTFPVQMSSFIGGPGPGQVVDDHGNVYLRTAAPWTQLPPRALREAAYAWLRYTASGELSDSLIPPRRRLEGVIAVSMGPGGRVAPFRVETFTVLKGDGTLLSARSDTYALTHGKSSGEVLRIERAHEPVGVSRSERGGWQRLADAADEVWGISSPALPRTKLPIAGLWIDSDDRIWVRRSVAAERVVVPEGANERRRVPILEWQMPPVYDIIDLEGTFLASVRLPWNTEPLATAGRRLWTLHKGEFDEEYVVIYELRGVG